MKTLSIIFTLLICSTLADAQSKTYYVDSAATNDSATCVQAQSTSTPKKTLQSALTCATAQNADIIQLRAGTHVVGQIDPPSGTSYANALTITNYPGETV